VQITKSTIIKVMTLPEEGTMELGSCISRVIHRDNTLSNIIIRPTCSCYEPDKSDVVDSIETEENSINKCIYYLNYDVMGSREWFLAQARMFWRDLMSAFIM
jgi:hypothetical protein